MPQLAGGIKGIADISLAGGVEDGGHDLDATGLCRVAQVDFQHLTDVHTGRNAQGVQHDVQRGAVGQVRHILLRQDAGNDTLVAVTACHLIADADLALLSDVAADDLADAGLQLIAVLRSEDLDIHDDAVLAVRHTQGGVTHLAGLFAKDGAEQALLSGQLGLALGGDLTNQNITALDLSADADDAALVQVFQSVLGNVGDITGDLLRSELGVTRLRLVLFNMNGGIHILADDLLVQQDGVLVVVALPGHEADQSVLAQRDLTVAHSRAIGQHLAGLDGLAHFHDGALVDTGARVGACELDQRVVVQGALLVADHHMVGIHLLHNAVVLCQNSGAGVGSCLILHTRCHNGLLGDHQRHCLTLHVGAHQCTVTVIVLQERDAGGRNRDHHTGRNVHIIDLCGVDFQNVVAAAGRNAGTDEVLPLVQRLVGLCHNVLVLDISGHILDLVGDDLIDQLAVLIVGLLHLAVRSLHEAVLVDLGVGCQIGDQTDVGAFRGLNGAHTAIVAVVDVADLETRAVTAQTAGAQSGQTALVGQLSQRVVLVHELRQRGRTEELLDGCHHRADVDEGLRGDDALILALQGHTLTDDALHAGETDAELVLQQLTDAADAAVAQVVDIIGGADAVAQAVQVVDGSQNVGHGDRTADQLVVVAAQHLFLLFHIGSGVQDLLDLVKGAALVDAALLDVKGEEALCVHTAVGDDLDVLLTLLEGIVHGQDDNIHTGGIGFLSQLAADLGASLHDQLPGQGSHDVLSGNITHDAACQRELLVHLITAETGQIVTARVEEQHVDLAGSRLHRGRLAGAQLAVNFQQALFLVLGGVLFQGSQDALVVTEEVQDVLIGGQAQCTAQHGDRQLAVLINTDIEHVGSVGLVLQPGAAVGVHGSAVQVVTNFILGISVEYAGRTDQLADDGTLSTVDHKGARIGHQREITHENFLVLDLAGLLVQQTGGNAQGGSVGHVALLALLDAVLGLLIQTEVHEAQRQVTSVVLNGADIVEDLFQALVQEPLIRVLLDLDQVRHTDDFVDVGEAHALGFAELYGLDFHHKINHSLLLYSTDLQ
ncbi:uncharacterized protein BN792_01787 [Faecalibacterium sp. CAG:82]|nr:uncharacterized protein BN792_01787 [Faecalibacterium sp. CAG:82]